MSGLVLERHRPTLPDLVGRRVAIAVAVLVALVAAAVLLLRSADPVDEYVQRSGLTFNFRYTRDLARLRSQGAEIVRLEQRRPGGLFVQSFAVEPLALPAYRGQIGGLLPVVSVAEQAALARRFRSFELVQEGKTSLNQVSGYAIVFRARLGARRLFGREILLPAPVPGSRRGVRLLLLATPSAGVNRAEDTGVRGVIKRPFRTFRFGTQAP